MPRAQLRRSRPHERLRLGEPEGDEQEPRLVDVVVVAVDDDDLGASPYSLRSRFAARLPPVPPPRMTMRCAIAPPILGPAGAGGIGVGPASGSGELRVAGRGGAAQADAARRSGTTLPAGCVLLRPGQGEQRCRAGRAAGRGPAEQVALTRVRPEARDRRAARPASRCPRRRRAPVRCRRSATNASTTAALSGSASTPATSERSSLITSGRTRTSWANPA